MLKQNIPKQQICEHLFTELETVESSDDNIPEHKPAENTGILEKVCLISEDQRENFHVKMKDGKRRKIRQKRFKNTESQSFQPYST